MGCSRGHDEVLKLINEYGEMVCAKALADPSEEGAEELAALIPDARYTAADVRPVVHNLGPEL